MKPLIAITMGDPAGIGPEIVAKALAERRVYDLCVPIVLGSGAVMRRAQEIVGTHLDFVEMREPAGANLRPCLIQCTRPEDGEHLPVFGRIDAKCGRMAMACIERGIRCALDREVDAVVTAPIHKESLHLAGYDYPGHTEIFAERTNTPDYALMLVDEGFRIVHVSTHVSMREALDRVTVGRIETVTQLGREACRRLGIARPRIAVAGLNCHAGEGGLFGREERDTIAPAVEALRRRRWDVSGPISPDTVFARARGGEFDLVVAMYHDQGHIAMKVAGFRRNPATGRWDSVRGVNVTLGLPIVRTSVDHGTAFDQAGKGTANPESLLQAIGVAVSLAAHKDNRRRKSRP